MKWFDKYNRQCLDLDKIAYWRYLSKDEAIAYNTAAKLRMQSPGSFVMLKTEEAALEIHFGGSDSLTFTGSEAEEIYKILTENK